MVERKPLLSQIARSGPGSFAADARTQYAALCFRPIEKTPAIEVLLITTRETGRWAIPKGWPMGKKLGHRVAEIEAFQEAGVRGRTDKKAFGYYTYLKRMPDGVTVPCIVEVHLLRVNGLRSKFKEAGQRTIRWFDPAEASAMVHEPELQGLLRRLQDLG